jgi:signal transduction histidine kinase
MFTMSLQAAVRLAMIGAALGSVLAVSAMIGAYQMLERVQQDADFAGLLNTNVGKLNLLTTELTVQRSRRPQYQWNRQFEITYDQLQGVPLSDSRLVALADEIRKRLETTKNLVDRLRLQVQPNSELTKGVRELRFSSVIANASAILSLTREAHQIMAEVARQTRTRVFLIIGVGAICGILSGGLILLSLCNDLLARILKLREVIQDIGGGNLEATVPARTPDEMGDVFHELDQMRCSLLNSMGELSRVNLELTAVKGKLEDRVAERTAQLESVNRDLESFSYAVSHDLRAPLRAISGFSRVVLEDYGDRIDAAGQDLLERIFRATQQMNQLIEDLLKLSHINQKPIARAAVDLSRVVGDIGTAVRERNPDRSVIFDVEAGLSAECDERLLAIALTNLIENAWKFTAGKTQAQIEFGRVKDAELPTFFIRDNGAGFDPRFKEKLFQPFQRLHAASEFPGTGIGLATVARIIKLHGGRIWAESEPGQGASFFIELGKADGADGSGDIELRQAG